jgi:hypothetical protein
MALVASGHRRRADAGPTKRIGPGMNAGEPPDDTSVPLPSFGARAATESTCHQIARVLHYKSEHEFCSSIPHAPPTSTPPSSSPGTLANLGLSRRIAPVTTTRQREKRQKWQRANASSHRPRRSNNRCKSRKAAETASVTPQRAEKTAETAEMATPPAYTPDRPPRQKSAESATREPHIRHAPEGTTTNALLEMRQKRQVPGRGKTKNRQDRHPRRPSLAKGGGARPASLAAAPSPESTKSAETAMPDLPSPRRERGRG